MGLTSNEGSKDFEQLLFSEVNKNDSAELLYQTVLKKVSQWGTPGNLMFVVGATKAEELAIIRKIIPDHFILVPGVGFQGGSLADVSKHGLNKDCGLLVNASRAIIYAGKKENFAEEARAIAQQYQAEMAAYLS